MLRNIAMLLISITLSAQSAKEPAPQPYEVPQAYEVYAAVLSLDRAKGDLLITGTTVPFNQCLDPRSDKPVDSAIKDYKKVNKIRWQLGRHLPIKTAYKLLSAEEADRLLQPDKTTGKWPLDPDQAIYRLSAVGFNSEKNIAFVAMDRICGGLCGGGQPYVLQKRDGQWQEYQGPDPKVIQRKKVKDGVYEVTMKGFMSFCGWYY